MGRKMDADALRLELIKTILHLPGDQLPVVADYLRRLPAAAIAPLNSPAFENLEKYWPHAPRHRLTDSGTYMVTTGTYLKQHFFGSADRLDMLESSLLAAARRYDWHL